MQRSLWIFGLLVLVGCGGEPLDAAPEPAAQHGGTSAEAKEGRSMPSFPVRLPAPGPYGAIATADGGVLVSRAGRTLLIDADGNTLRSFDCGGPAAVTNTGDVILATASCDACAGDACIVALDPRLDAVRWSFLLSAPARHVGVDAQGRVVATGPVTVALDADGQLLWSRQLSGTALAVAPEGAAIVAGEFLDTLSLGADEFVSATPAAFVARLSTEGDVVWSYALSASALASARAVAVAPQGDVFLTGAFRGALAGSGLSWTADVPNTRGYLLHLDEAGQATELLPLPLADVADVALSVGGAVAVTGHTGDDGPRAQVVLHGLGARQLGVLDTGAGYGHAVSWQRSRTLLLSAEHYGPGGLLPVLEQLEL